jgi:predicted ATPase
LNSDGFGEWRLALRAYPFCLPAMHSPMLMAHPGGPVLRLSKYGLDPVVEETEHFRMREFWAAPAGLIRTMSEE